MLEYVGYLKFRFFILFVFLYFPNEKRLNLIEAFF